MSSYLRGQSFPSIIIVPDFWVIQLKKFNNNNNNVNKKYIKIITLYVGPEYRDIKNVYLLYIISTL